MYYKSCKKFSSLFSMDSVFLLGEGDLSTFFQHMMQQFGCTYLCLWLYSPQSHQSPNCLCYKDGFYIERNTQQTSSSSGTIAERLFIDYRQSIFILESSHIPGIAFQNNLPYTEFNFNELLALATTDIQRQFYQEAGIKTAVFMGCNVGEIEMGFSSNTVQVNLKMQIRNWFPDDFSRTPPQPQLVTTTDLPQPTDQQNPGGAASSSSSLRSYSYDSTAEYSPLLFDIPSSSNYTSPEANLEQAALRPAPSSSTVSATPHHQAMIRTLLSHRQSNRIPYVDAVLAVISSSSPPSSSNFQPHQNVPPNEQGSAFKRYRQSLGPRITNESRIRVSGQPADRQQRRQNMLKRSIAFIRRLNTMRAQEEQIQAIRPSSAQLHHMISERRRREKINESFQALRSLLPPGTKKDKASVLARTSEYLSSLKSQVAELSKRNQILEARLLPQKTVAAAETTTSDSSNRNTLDVRITNVGEPSTSEARTVDLHVTRSGENGILDNVFRLMEFLRRDENVSVMSIEANSTTVVDSVSVNSIVLRLRIEVQGGSEWDEPAFQEAVERIFN